MMGFVPLLIENDPFWRPLAIAISGGISGSSILALYFVPAMYMFAMHQLPRRFGKHKTKTSSNVSNPAY